MRILAGCYKGHRLLSPPPRAATRPITGRAKKSLFDTLAPRLADAIVLDLYCGTGTMGLEALSRGAKACWFADRDARVLARLKRNIEALGAAERCTVWRGDVAVRLARWLEGIDVPVDVAFVDPPYALARRWKWPTAETKIFAPLAESLADDGLVVLRTPAGLTLPERIAGLYPARTRKYGGTAVALLEKTCEACLTGRQAARSRRGIEE